MTQSARFAPPLLLAAASLLAFGCSSSSREIAVDGAVDAKADDSAPRDDAETDGALEDGTSDGVPKDSAADEATKDGKADSAPDSAEPPCPQTPCEIGLSCCSGVCKNLNNDPTNCGKCGSACPSDKPFCSGSCGQPFCSDADSCSPEQTCCGATCCEAGKICCSVNYGPSVLECHDGPACPKGCPGCVCAAPDTLIATPTGARPIVELRVGDQVISWHRGRLRAVALRRVHRQPAIAHRVVRVELSSGVVLNISGTHPTADGRSFIELRSGDWLGGQIVREASVVSYPYGYTYDILPASDSGTYIAGGVLIGSTLKD